LIAVDIGNGQTVAIGQIDEKDPQAVNGFLGPLVQRLGVSVIVTDDLFSYKKVSPEPIWNIRCANSMCAAGCGAACKNWPRAYRPSGNPLSWRSSA